MRGKFTLIPIIALLLLSAVPCGCSDASVPEGDLQLDMVCPVNPECFTIVNASYAAKDLRDYTVTDGEGTVSFTESMILQPGQSVTVMSDAPAEWMMIADYRLMGQDGIVAKKFTLADAGDDIYLKRGDTVIDSFAWGSVFGDVWTGNGLAKIPKKTMAMRNHAYGSPGETEVWRTYVPGMTLYHYPRTFEGCVVTPFSFPESNGSEIIKALQDAHDYVDISIYTISHPDVASVLLYLLNRGVDVRILIEGSPAGGITSEEITMLTTLSRNGADIHILKSDDSYKRYPYVHSKYAVIDDSTVVITSENWTESSFSSNRGWGCVIKNESCARYLKLFFDSDFDLTKRDVFTLKSVYPTSTSCRIQEFHPVICDSRTYTADVTPVVSPDYSRKALMAYLSDASERIYSQQLYVDYDWLGGRDNPLSEMERLAQSGVDCRLLVDVTYDDPFDSDLKDGYGIVAYYEENGLLDVRYEESSAFSMAHNKGIVKDDTVWIGSMNWTENSVSSNREMSVIIRSREVSDIYADLFLTDWGIEFDGTVSLSVRVSGDGYGEYAKLDASDSSVPQGSVFEWDLDGDGEYEKTGRSVRWKFYEGTECTLRVTTPEGTEHEYAFTVSFDEERGGISLDGPIKYLPLVILCIMIIAVKRIRRAS